MVKTFIAAKISNKILWIGKIISSTFEDQIKFVDLIQSCKRIFSLFFIIVWAKQQKIKQIILTKSNRNESFVLNLWTSW
jgi:hypothetical protein